MTWHSLSPRHVASRRFAIGLCAMASLCLLAKVQQTSAGDRLSGRIITSRISTVKFHADEKSDAEPVAMLKASETLPVAQLPVAQLPTKAPTVGKLVRDVQVQTRIARAPKAPTNGLAALPIVAEEFNAQAPQSPLPMTRKVSQTRVGRVVAPSTTNQWVALYGSDYREARTPRSSTIPSEEMPPSETMPMELSAPLRNLEKPSLDLPSLEKRAVDRKAEPATAPQASKSSVIYSSVGPAIRIEAIGPKRVTVGLPEKYRVTLQNKSVIAARGVIVRLALPQSVEVTNSNASLGEVQRDYIPSGDYIPSESRKLVWALEVLPPLSEQSLELTIAAQIDGPLDLDIEWTLLPQTETIQLQTQQPRLELWLDGPGQVIRGDAPRYTVVVSNPGTGPARNVEVLVTSAGGVGKKVPIGTVAAGESSSFQVELADLDPGTTQLEATATAALGIKAAAFHAISVNNPELAISGLGPAAHAVDAQATYQVNIRNVGSAVAQGVVATFNKPAGIVWSDLPVSAQHQKHQIVWPIGDLDPGQELTYTLTGRLVEAGEQLLQFSVRDQRGNQAAVDVLTAVEPVADVQLTVQSNRTRLPVGEETYCDIVVENRGNQAAENISVVVDFASGIQPLQATGQPADILLDDVQFEPIARLAPGEQIKLRVAVRGKQPGAHDYRVAVTSEDRNLRLAHEGTIQCYQTFTATPGVQMRVVARNTSAQVGDEVIYDIELKNSSNHSVGDVRAAIHFSPGFDPIAVRGASARISDGSVLFESLGTVERSRPRTITVTARASRPGRHTYLAEVTTANGTSQSSSGSIEFYTARRTNTSRIVR